MTTTMISETRWRERSNPVGPLTTTVIGAALGFAVGYLYLTESGRRFRSRIEPWLDQSVEEIRRLRGAAVKARRAWDEGRDSLSAVRHLGQAPPGQSW